MFDELEKVMDFAIGNGNFMEALKQNVTGKKSNSGVEKTKEYLKKLYSFDTDYPLFNALKYFWKVSDEKDKPRLALCYAISHDYLLAESISVIFDTNQGEKVTVGKLENNIETHNPNKYSANTRKSIAQNIASSWKQAGFIEGKVKNIRVQPEISYNVACFAFLLAWLRGDKGDFIWNNIGVRALCQSESKLRNLAIDCAKRDLMQYQYAGSVTAISFNLLLNKIGIDGI